MNHGTLMLLDWPNQCFAYLQCQQQQKDLSVSKRRRFLKLRNVDKIVFLSKKNVTTSCFIDCLTAYFSTICSYAWYLKGINLHSEFSTRVRTIIKVLKQDGVCATLNH